VLLNLQGYLALVPLALGAACALVAFVTAKRQWRLWAASTSALMVVCVVFGTPLGPSLLSVAGRLAP
jgi:hypothetical protein